MIKFAVVRFPYRIIIIKHILFVVRIERETTNRQCDFRYSRVVNNNAIKYEAGGTVVAMPQFTIALIYSITQTSIIYHTDTARSHPNPR